MWPAKAFGNLDTNDGVPTSYSYLSDFDSVNSRIYVTGYYLFQPFTIPFGINSSINTHGQMSGFVFFDTINEQTAIRISKRRNVFGNFVTFFWFKCRAGFVVKMNTFWDLIAD